MRVADFFAIKGAVVAILETALPDFTVTWGFTTRNVPKNWCYVGRLTWPDGEWATNRSRELEVSIPIVLNGLKVRVTPKEAETWLADQVKTIVAAFDADSTLRSQGVVTWGLTPKTFGSQPHADGGIEVESAFDLRVTYRP